MKRNKYSPIPMCVFILNEVNQQCLVHLERQALDLHESVHHDTIVKVTNKMQLCRLI